MKCLKILDNTGMPISYAIKKEAYFGVFELPLDVFIRLSKVPIVWDSLWVLHKIVRIYSIGLCLCKYISSPPLSSVSLLLGIIANLKVLIR